MAIGDLVATLSIPGVSGASFQLVENPGNLFTLSGNLLLQAVDVPSGNYPITIQSQFQGQVLTQSFVVDHLPFPPPPPPPPPLTSSIAVVPDTLGVGQTATVYFTWNDTVEDFTPAAVAVTHGSIGALTQVSPILFTAIFTPATNVFATATLQVQQSGVGGAVYFNAAGSTTEASNIADVSVDTVDPVSGFFVSLNLAGAQNPNPDFPSVAAINYFVTRLNNNGPPRIPFSWAINSPQLGVTGIQQTAFGPLDTTSGYLNSGPNVLSNSQALASSPWALVNENTGSSSSANNAGVAPDGTNTATLLTFNRSDTTSLAQIQQQFTQISGSAAGFVYLKAATPGDVGKQVSISMYNTDYNGLINVTLTNSWVQYNFTSLTGAQYAIIGYFRALSAPLTGPVSILAWGAQVNLGSLPLPYSATNTGYLGALDLLVTSVGAAGAQCFLDCHMFGNGPGGTVGSVAVPITAFADLWGKIAAHYVSRPSLLAAIFGFDIMNEWPNGFDSSIVFNASQAAITAIRDAGFIGFIIIEGTNFSSAWNWVSGDGQPFNSAGLYALVDPLNKLIMSPHMYPDSNDSGGAPPGGFGYVQQATTPGTAPVGLNTNPMIGVERMSREYVPWAQQHGLASILGEYGSSNDSPWASGTFDFPDWNVVTRNLLTYLQTNNVGISMWSGWTGNGGIGYGPGFYPYGLDPFNVNLSGSPDYSATGVQHPAMVVLDEFTGYSGPQPQAYMVFQPGLANPQLYSTVGSPTSPFTVYYGGLISSPVTITPHALLTDGVTSAGGTFIPATITLSAGENGLATFTYTPSQPATIVISTTNSAGWTNPPAIGISSIVDGYVALPAKPSNIYGMYNRYTPNVGPALRLQRSADGQQMDWFLTLPNSAGYNGFDRNAIQAWASARSGITVLTRYDMSGSGNHMTFSGATLPTLNLQNAAGYPEIDYGAGCEGVFNTPINGQTQFYTIARFNMSVSSGGALYRMDWFNGPIAFGVGGSDAFNIFATGNPPPSSPPAFGSVNTSLSFGLVKGAYHDYGISYSSGVTNGFVTYKDGTPVASATVTYELGADNQNQVNFAYFRFGAAFFVGSDYNMEIGQGFTLTSGQQSNIASIDTTYYSTALPDVLTAVPPSISGVLSNFAIFPGFIPARPFGILTVTDTNGGATETITITLSGAAGTLSGSGISGSGPYTIGPDTPANVTTILNQAVFTTAAGLGSTTTFALLINSSAGGSTSNNSTSTIVSTYSAQAALTPPPGTFTPVNHSGYNLAGGELDPSFGLGPKPFQLDYMASKGFGLMRYVVSSRYFYTSAFGPLNPSFLATMRAVIDYAFTKNIYVIIDPHTSGFTFDPVLATGVLVAPNTRSQDLFQDSWRRLAAAFINYPNVIFGLMNEPGQTAANWLNGAVNPSVSAIRATGATQLILIPGVGASSALGWASNGNSATFAGYAGDPLNNFAFEAHQYLDSTASGTSPVSTISGATALNTFNTFLSANGFKGFLGEFGMSWDPWFPIAAGSNELFDASMAHAQTTNNITQYTAMLNSLIATGNYVGWAQWGGGNENQTPPSQNGYYFQPEPQKASGSAYVMPLVEQPFIGTLVSKII